MHRACIQNTVFYFKLSPQLLVAPPLVDIPLLVELFCSVEKFIKRGNWGLRENLTGFF